MSTVRVGTIPKEIVVSMVTAGLIATAHASETKGSAETTKKNAENICEAYKVIYDTVLARIK